MPTPATGIPDADRPLPGARGALLLLLAINLFNYIDRQVLAAVVPDIRRAFFDGRATGGTAHLLAWCQDHLGFRPQNALIGVLSMAFMAVYMVGAPLFARLAGRHSRWAIVGAAVIAWSAATGASGLAATFGALLLTRCFVGVGEAAYGPIAQAVLADLYPLRRRGRVLAWFNMAIPVGSALGFVLGGFFAHRWPEAGWRWAFGVAVLPGVALGLLALRRARRPGAPAASPSAAGPGAAHAAPGWRDCLELFRTPSYVLCTAGMCAMTFSIGGIGFWMVDYVETFRQAGSHAAVIFGLILVAAGLGATLLGGMAGDRLSRRWPGAYFLVSGAAMLAGFPVFLLVLRPEIPFPLAWVFVFLSCFCLFFNTGPTNAILANVARPALRPLAFGVNILLIHALGDVPSPTIIGLIADRCGGDMNAAFRAVAVLFVFGGLCWLAGARFLARDTARAACPDAEDAGRHPGRFPPPGEGREEGVPR